MIYFKYDLRYETEINQAKRPCIRLIMEGDANQGGFMILCVSAVISSGTGGRFFISILLITDAILWKIGDGNFELELTDGWYPMRAAIDSVLSHCVSQGKIYVGMKLQIHGAQVRKDSA